MTNTERWDYFESGELQRAAAVDLLDWAGYWTAAGTGSLTPLLAAQTEAAINMILDDLGYINKKVCELAITDDTIKNAAAGSVTEAMILNVVNSIMLNKIAYLTGVTSVPES